MADRPVTSDPAEPDQGAVPEHDPVTGNGADPGTGVDASGAGPAAGRGRVTSLGAVLAAVAALAGLLAGTLFGPQHQVLGPQISGDVALAERVRAVVGDRGGFRALAVAEVTPDGITTAGLGNSGPGRDGPPPAPDARFELGSITKTFTAALFADAIRRGEVRADDPLARHLPDLAGTPAGGVTLASLAQHRSGLPPLGATAAVQSLLAGVLNDNPYASTTTAQLVEDARAAPVDAAQPPTYSNFGVSLLGTALTRAAGAPDYPALVAQRITGPTGMAATSFGPGDADVPQAALPGFLANGTPAPRWNGEGYLPSGNATFTTIGDTARWAQAQLTGTAPGNEALTPTADDEPGARIGWIWVTSEETGPDGARHPMVWHNGGTGGFRTMLALDREQRRAVVVLGNTTTDVDDIAPALLWGTPLPSRPVLDTVPAWVAFAVALLFSATALWRALRRTTLLPIAEALVLALAGLVLLWLRGPWADVGGWAYGVVLAPAAAALAVTLLRARGLRTRPERRVLAAWGGPVVAVLFLVVTVAMA
ncbi:serine hydrolase domain-containing protein [Pseudonocardia phyllosphaerae]|uniref:serine hydrolase domain-containing protein n=1 Tax=Pseudonocardia phyllosphaerae TaxID=3390502 RepID=UPI00397BD131